MSKIDAYRQKLEAKLEENMARFDQIKAQAKGQVADQRLKAEEALDDLQKRAYDIRGKLNELADAGAERADQLKDRAEAMLDELSLQAKGVLDKLKNIG